MDIKNLGFDSWVELYEYLIEENVHNEQRVLLFWPEGYAVDDITIEPGESQICIVNNQVQIDVDWIKANAFSELFPALPLKSSISVLTDVVESLTHLAGKKNTEPLLEFLNKIPTRRS